ncbi:hypothetical protein MT325_m250L [Paramecium bursaria chlorella virus MT325]|uniref:Uncharacterized protein m250L n=1 Tax=Paramecium bursaria Chlorella virus MT325 TaxID=346932 RepID=A7ITY0_PBCVM|nr:hypothetical protein MT325_m250L [Paramecium bursaria chlorella virus MT325]
MLRTVVGDTSTLCFLARPTVSKNLSLASATSLEGTWNLVFLASFLFLDPNIPSNLRFLRIQSSGLPPNSFAHRQAKSSNVLLSCVRRTNG